MKPSFWSYGFVFFLVIYDKKALNLKKEFPNTGSLLDRTLTFAEFLSSLKTVKSPILFFISEMFKINTSIASNVEKKTRATEWM